MILHKFSLLYICIALILCNYSVKCTDEIAYRDESIVEDSVVCPSIGECYFGVVSDCPTEFKPIKGLKCCPRCDCSLVDCAQTNVTECLRNGGNYIPASPFRCCAKCSNRCEVTFCPNIECDDGTLVKADPVNGRCCDQCIVPASSDLALPHCGSSRCLEVTNCNGKIIKKNVTLGICCDSCLDYCDHVRCVPPNYPECKARGGFIVPHIPALARCCPYCRVPPITTTGPSTSGMSTTITSSSGSTITDIPPPSVLASTTGQSVASTGESSITGFTVTSGRPIPTTSTSGSIAVTNIGESSITGFTATSGRPISTTSTSGSITVANIGESIITGFTSSNPTVSSSASTGCRVPCPFVSPALCAAQGRSYIGANPPTQCCARCGDPITSTGTTNPCETVRCKLVTVDECNAKSELYVAANPPQKCCASCVPIITSEPIV